MATTRRTVLDPEAFTALGADGLPTGESVTLPKGGRVGPFEWRPCGSLADGDAAVLALRFPAGGTISGSGVLLTIRSAQFVLVGSRQGIARVLGTVSSAGPARFTTGPLDVVALCEALGLPATSGIPVLLGHAIVGCLTGGRFTLQGIEDPVMSIGPSGIPFAERLGLRQGLVLAPGDAGALCFELSGQLALGEGSDSCASLVIDGARPLRLHLESDGAWALAGEATLDVPALSAGMRVALEADGTCLAMSLQGHASQLAHARALLVSALPDPTTVLPDATADAPAMAHAVLLMHSKRRLFLRHALLFGAAADPRAGTLRRPMVTEVLGLLLLASEGTVADTDAGLAAAMREAGRHAAAAGSVMELAQAWWNLERLRLLGMDAQLLAPSLDAAARALGHRLDAADHPLSIDELRMTLAIGAERCRLAEARRVDLGHDPLRPAWQSALDAALQVRCTQFGVRSGEFAAASGSVVLQRHRRLLLQDLRCLAGLHLDAQSSGLSISDDLPWNEVVGQIGRQLLALLSADLAEAGRTRQELAARDILTDLAELAAFDQAGLFDAHPLQLPDWTALCSVWTMAAESRTASSKKQWPLATWLAQVQRIGVLLDAVPTDVTCPVNAIRRSHDGLMSALKATFPPPVDASGSSLLDTLRAGVAAARLRDRLGFPDSRPAWESAARLGAVVDAVAVQCVRDDDAVSASNGLVILLDEAEQALSMRRPARYRIYFTESQKLLRALHAVARSCQLRPAPADEGLRLAGGLMLDQLTGGFRWCPGDSTLIGFAAGSLQLPGMQGALTVERLAFEGLDRLSMTAHGDLALARDGESGIHLAVPSERPLQFALTTQGLTLSGGARLTVGDARLDVGLAMEEGLLVADARATGLALDAARSLRLMLPTWPTAATLAPALQRDINACLVALADGLAAFGDRSSSRWASALRPSALPPEDDPAIADALTAVRLALLRVAAGLTVPQAPADLSAGRAAMDRLILAIEDRHVDGRCSSPAARRQAHAALRLISEVRQLESLQQRDATTDMLMAQAGRLSTSMPALVQCLRQGAPSDSLADDTEHLALFDALVAADAKPETVRQGADLALNSWRTRLEASGFDPSSGLPRDASGRLPPLGEADLDLLLRNLALRSALIQRAEVRGLAPASVPGAGPAIATSNLGVIVATATDHALAARWAHLVIEGRALLADRPPKVSEHVFLTIDHPLCLHARAHGRKLKRWYRQCWAFYTMFQRRATHGLPVPHVRHPDAPLDPLFDDDLAVVNDAMWLQQVNNLDSSVYGPIRYIHRYPALPGIKPIPVVGVPFIEGWADLDEPYQVATRKYPNRTLAANDFGRPPAANAQALAAWKRWRGATLGMPPQAVAVPGDAITTLLAEVQAGTARFVAQPAMDLGLRLARRLQWLLLVVPADATQALQTAAQEACTRFDVAFMAWARAHKAIHAVGAHVELLTDAAGHAADIQSQAAADLLARMGQQALTTGAAVLNDLSALLPSQRPVDLPLPGPVQIEEIFGECLIDLHERRLSARFGGLLVFADIGLRARIISATLDSQGRLALSASLTGPVPHCPGLSWEGTLQASCHFRPPAPGQPAQAIAPLAIAGSATLRWPDGRLLACTIAWATDTGTLQLSARGEHLDLQFGDALALLSGGVELRLARRAGHPATSTLELQGTVGLLARSPLPNDRPLHVGDFHLVADQQVVRLTLNPASWQLVLPSGSLLLPDAFSSGEGAQRLRARVAIDPVRPVTLALTWSVADGQAAAVPVSGSFLGVLRFAHLGLQCPDGVPVGIRGLTGQMDFGQLRLHIASARVAIAAAPSLVIDSGELYAPHPDGQGNIVVHVGPLKWQLDGWPEGTLRLARDVPLLARPGISLALLGSEDDMRTGLEIRPGATPSDFPVLRFFGELALLFDDNLLAAVDGTTAAGSALLPQGRVGGRAFGSLRLQARPTGVDLALQLSELTFEGDFCLGGRDGVRVRGRHPGQGASVRITNPGNIVALADTPDRQVVVTLDGQVGSAGMPAFGLGDTRLIFFAPDRPPRLVPGALVYDGRDWTLTRYLPASLDQATLRFKNPDRPLQELLRPGNLEITCALRIGLPTLEEGQTVLGGGADGVVIDFGDQGAPRLRNLDGIELTLAPGLEIPPIEDLGGSLYLSGLQTPERLLLAGRIGGSVNGYKLSFLAAFTPTGPLGLAIDFNAGSVGIPLGPTGFLFTGAAGGISFLNTMTDDPTKLKGYLRESTQPAGFKANPDNPPPPATMDWAAFKKWRATLLAQVPVFPPLGSGPVIPIRSAGDDPPGDPIGCPVDVPPPSANILGMPHPDQDRFPALYVLKFSAIPESTLNKPVARGGLGITREAIQSLNLGGTTLAARLATLVVDRLRPTVPPVPTQLGPGARQAIEGLWTDLQTGLRASFEAGLARLGSGATAQDIYAVVRDRAWAGVPVKDATFAVKGVFTHTCVSAFVNVEGYGTIGSVGSAGVGGRLNLLGVPVGRAQLFLSVTDANGNPNPQLTGSADITLGPLQIGEVTAALKADGAVTGVAAVIADLVATLGDGLTGELLAALDPALAGATLARAERIVAERGNTAARKALAVALLHQALVGQVLDRLARGLLADKTDAVASCIAGLIDQVKPEFVACGEASVRFAGLKLADGFYRMKFRSRIVERSGFREGTVEAYFGGNPAACIGYGTPIMLLTAGLDHASFQYAETVPDATGLVKSLLLRRIDSPQRLQEHAREQLRRMLAHSTITGTYELHPLGFAVARAQARLIHPDFTLHPVVRRHDPALADWVRPGMGTAAGLPPRQDLLMAAVRADRLGSVFWKGTGGDLAALFPDCAALQGKTLQRDYFPHGGLVLAAMLDVPRILTTLPRREWAVLVGGSDLKERFEALVAIVRDYLVSAVQVGHLTAYVPCPNPPALFRADGRAIVPPPSLDPLALVESLKTFEPDKTRTAELWELGESFAYFHLRGTLLDIPVGDVCLAAEGPNPVTGDPAMFTGRVTVPPDSWIAALYGSVELTVKIAGQSREPRRTLVQALHGPLGRLDRYRADGNASTPGPADLAELAREVVELVQCDLPRVELSARARLLTDPLGIPLSTRLRARDAVTVTAYSPGWLPVLPNDHTPLQRLQHLGGIAMSGTWSLASLLSLRGLVLVEPPVAAGQLPRLLATLSGEASLQVPLPGAATPLPLGQIEARFDSQSPQFFQATATVSADVAVQVAGGWPVTVPLGARVTVENHRATVDFDCNGSRARLTVDLTDAREPKVRFSGTLVLGSLTSGVLSLRPLPGAAQIRVDVGPGGARATGARLVVGGPIGLALTLPAFDIAFPPTITAPLSAALPAGSIGGLGLEQLEMTVRLDRGKLSVPAFSAWLPVDRLFPGMPRCRLVGGPLDEGGGFSLAGDVPALRLGRLALTGAGGAPVPLVLTPAGLVATIGAIGMPGLIPLPWKPLRPFTLNWPKSPTDDAVLANIAAAPVLGDHRFDDTNLVLERRAGQVQLRIDSAKLRVGPLTLPGSFAGSISSSGEFKLVARLDNDLLFGFPVSGALTLAMRDPISALESLPAPSAWWRLDAVSGLGVADASGKGHAGSAPQASQVATPAGVPLPWPVASQPLVFDGIDDHFSVPHHSDLDGSTALTISAWFRVKAFSRTWQTIVSKGDSAWRLARHGDSATIAFDSTHVNGAVQVLPAKSRVDDDRWHHVVVVFDGSRKSIYIDGKREASAGIAVPIATNTFPVMLGANAQAPGRHWSGALAEVMVWPCALAEAAVPALGTLPSRIGVPQLSLWARINLRGVSDSVPGAWRPTFSGDVSASGEFRLTADGPGGPLLGFPFRDLTLAFERTGSAPTARLSGRGTLTPPGKPPGAPFPALSSGPSFDMLFSHANGQTRLVATARLDGGTVGGFQVSTSERARLLLDGQLGSPGAIAFSNLQLIGPALANWPLQPLAGVIRPDGAIESPPLALPATPVPTIGGWEVQDITARFNGLGLEIGGSFVIAVRKPPWPVNEFGRIVFKGLLHPDGRTVLTGRGQLNFGGCSTEETAFSIDLRTPDRLLPERPPRLKYSGLTLPMSDFRLQPDRFDASIERRFPEGDARVTLHTCHWPDDPSKPHPPQSHLKLEFDARVTLRYDLATRSLSHKLSGRLDWRAENRIPPAPPGRPWPTSGGFNLDDGNLALDEDGNFVIASIKDLPDWLSKVFGGAKFPFG